jgi:YHS domain-containing protein
MSVNISTHTQGTSVKGFENLNRVTSDTLPRDREQSNRLHEPDHLINTIDPITSRDIENVESHPSIVDDNLTIYFESEKTRQAFREMPVDHPYAHLPDNFPKDVDRGG